MDTNVISIRHQSFLLRGSMYSFDNCKELVISFLNLQLDSIRQQSDKVCIKYYVRDDMINASSIEYINGKY